MVPAAVIRALFPELGTKPLVPGQGVGLPCCCCAAVLPAQEESPCRGTKNPAGRDSLLRTPCECAGPEHGALSSLRALAGLGEPGEAGMLAEGARAAVSNVKYRLLSETNQELQ